MLGPMGYRALLNERHKRQVTSKQLPIAYSRKPMKVSSGGARSESLSLSAASEVSSLITATAKTALEKSQRGNEQQMINKKEARKRISSTFNYSKVLLIIATLFQLAAHCQLAAAGSEREAQSSPSLEDSGAESVIQLTGKCRIL